MTGSERVRLLLLPYAIDDPDEKIAAALWIHCENPNFAAAMLLEARAGTLALEMGRVPAGPKRQQIRGLIRELLDCADRMRAEE